MKTSHPEKLFLACVIAELDGIHLFIDFIDPVPDGATLCIFIDRRPFNCEIENGCVAIPIGRSSPISASVMDAQGERLGRVDFALAKMGDQHVELLATGGISDTPPAIGDSIVGLMNGYPVAIEITDCEAFDARGNYTCTGVSIGASPMTRLYDGCGFSCERGGITFRISQARDPYKRYGHRGEDLVAPEPTQRQRPPLRAVVIPAAKSELPPAAPRSCLLSFMGAYWICPCEHHARAQILIAKWRADTEGCGLDDLEAFKESAGLVKCELGSLTFTDPAAGKLEL